MWTLDCRRRWKRPGTRFVLFTEKTRNLGGNKICESDAPRREHHALLLDSVLRSSFAEILAESAGSSADASATTGALLRVCERISVSMTPLIGQRAAQALFAETVRTIQQRFRWAAMEEAVDTPDSAAVHVSVALSQMDSATAHDAAIAILVRFSQSLASFVGESLMLQTLQETWPGCFEMQNPTETPEG